MCLREKEREREREREKEREIVEGGRVDMQFLEQEDYYKYDQSMG